ncbi:MAG TPA: cobalamin-dependent protein, partial [Acidimicrobiales bacterium]|nr:cobalamin-dependent protein [Acidimicrobiales bacterium]
MTDLHRPAHPVRFVTAASLFDGHDAAINIMRRLLQAQGAEVVHLGHNRSVDEVVTAAVQEDVQGVAVSSYQGGHVEYFQYLVDRLRAEGRPEIRVYGGGGGTITAAEIEALHRYGVTRIFSPHDGQEMGLARMVNTLVAECDFELPGLTDAELEALLAGDTRALARAMTTAENDRLSDTQRSALASAAGGRRVPVLGLTGTGGSGKSSLTDELVQRFRLDQEDKLRIAVLAIDPTRRKAGGALLGDRIRMNSIGTGSRIFFRSFATRGAGGEMPAALDDAITACRAAGFDLVVVETPGIGQGDSAVVSHVDLPVYVMTPEYGSPSQLEKIDMLDFAAAVAINKFERRGGEDALRDVRRTLARNPDFAGTALDELPVFGTVASRFADDGVTALYQFLRERLGFGPGVLQPVSGRVSTRGHAIVPAERTRYLADVAERVRAYHRTTQEEAE